MSDWPVHMRCLDSLRLPWLDDRGLVHVSATLDRPSRHLAGVQAGYHYAHQDLPASGIHQTWPLRQRGSSNPEMVFNAQESRADTSRLAFAHTGSYCCSNMAQ